MRALPFVGLLLPLALAACASGSGSPASGGPASARSGHSSITAEQLLELQASNAYDALQQLRPEWLRGGTAFGGRPGVVVVYLDGNRYGEPLSLRQIPLEHITSMRYLNTSDMRAELPLSQLEGVSGAIMVSTSRLGEARIEAHELRSWAPTGRYVATVHPLAREYGARRGEGRERAFAADEWEMTVREGTELPSALAGVRVQLANGTWIELTGSRTFGVRVEEYQRWGTQVNLEQTSSSLSLAAGRDIGPARLMAGPILARRSHSWTAGGCRCINRTHRSTTERGAVGALSVNLPAEGMLAGEFRIQMEWFRMAGQPGFAYSPPPVGSGLSVTAGLGIGVRR
jgi:hypothetical protein